jgi:hypothetical protein
MPNDSEKEKLDLLRTLMDQTVEDIKAEMRRLKLDRGKASYRRPVDLLEEAYLAIRYPASAQGAASSALLALRGSIDRSIEELVGRCPAQKPAENRRDRILALGLHCGRNGLPVAHFDSLATDDEFVNTELSGTVKAAAMAWPDLVKQFLRGAQFLQALLASMDEALLRP